MKSLWNIHETKSQSGFTLIELLVAIAMVAIVLAAIVGMFERLSRSYTTQNSMADLQQGVRATLDVMADDIRMAGYNPLDTQATDPFGIEIAETFRLRITADRDGDGVINTAPAGEEIITYLYNPGQRSVQKRWSEGRPSQDTETLLGGTDNPINVIALSFNYLDSNNNPTTIRSAIRAIEVTLTAEAPAGRDGMARRTYKTRIEGRNLR